MQRDDTARSTRDSAVRAAPSAGAEWRAGWPIVWAAMLGGGLGPGLYQNLSSLFTPSLEQAFGWSRGAIATAAGLGLVGALAAPLIGRIADRIGVRPVIVTAMLALSAGYLWLAAIDGPMWHYQAGVLLLVLAVPGTSSLAYGKLIAARFVTGRGLALALGTSGLAITTMIVAPILGAIIATRGWRAGFVALAIGSGAIALPLVLLAIRSVPAGPTPVDPAAPAAPLSGVSAAQARRDPRFWIIVAAAALINLATTGLVTQMVPIGLELGLSGAEAALLLTAFGVSAIVGRLAIGVLIDRVRPQRAAAAFAAVSAVGFALLAAGGQGPVAIMAAVFLAGLMNGAENDLLPFLAARLFGLRAFAEIYGTAIPIGLVGTAIGIIGFGRLHDAFGSYAIALAIGSAALGLTVLLYLTLGDRPLQDA